LKHHTALAYDCRHVEEGFGLQPANWPGTRQVMDGR